MEDSMSVLDLLQILVAAIKHGVVKPEVPIRLVVEDKWYEMENSLAIDPRGWMEIHALGNPQDMPPEPGD